MLNIKKFSATWCVPCKRYDPIITKVVESRDDVTLEKIDIEEFPDLASKYGVKGVPFTVLEDDEGTVLGGFSGAVTEANLRKIIDRYRAR